MGNNFAFERKVYPPHCETILINFLNACFFFSQLKHESIPQLGVNCETELLSLFYRQRRRRAKPAPDLICVSHWICVCSSRTQKCRLLSSGDEGVDLVWIPAHSFNWFSLKIDIPAVCSSRTEGDFISPFSWGALNTLQQHPPTQWHAEWVAEPPTEQSTHPSDCCVT